MCLEWSLTSGTQSSQQTIKQVSAVSTHECALICEGRSVICSANIRQHCDMHETATERMGCTARNFSLRGTRMSTCKVHFPGLGQQKSACHKAVAGARRWSDVVQKALLFWRRSGRQHEAGMDGQCFEGANAACSGCHERLHSLPAVTHHRCNFIYKLRWSDMLCRRAMI